MHRIHSKNRPIRDFSKDHPARATLVAHIECRRQCVGREIPWPGREAEAIDQEWYSSIEGRNWNFSGFAYTHLSFDLVLDEWLDQQSPFDAEPNLAYIAKLLGMLAECESAGRREDNVGVLQLIPIVRKFLTLWQTATRLRASLSRTPTQTG